METSRFKKSGINAIAGIAQTIVNIFVSLISRIIFVRVLSVGYLGINGLFTNILSVLSLADLGITTAMMYSLYKPIAENNTNQVRDLIGFFRKIYLIIAISVLVIGMIIIPALPYIINLEEPIVGINGYYLLALLNVVISYLFIYRTTLLTADQKNYILSKYIIIFKVITLLAQTIVLICTKNYFIYLLTALIVTFIGNLVQNRVALKLYPYLQEKSQPISKDLKSQIFANVKDLFIYKVSVIVQNNTDNILISIMIGTVYVGYYSNYLLIMSAVKTVLANVFSSVKASVGNLVASNGSDNKKKGYIYWVMEFVNFWLVAFCSVCFLCLYADCIELFFGKEYILAGPIVFAMVLNFYTNNIRQTIWVYRETNGIFHETRFITMVTSVLNVFLSIIMGYYWGMFGILIGTVIARFLYAWWKEPVILFTKFFEQSATLYIKKYLCRAGLCCIISSITWFLCNLVQVDSLIVRFFLKIIICAIIPNIILLVIYHRTEEFRYLYNKIVRPIKEKRR